MRGGGAVRSWPLGSSPCFEKEQEEFRRVSVGSVAKGGLQPARPLLCPASGKNLLETGFEKRMNGLSH